MQLDIWQTVHTVTSRKGPAGAHRNYLQDYPPAHIPGNTGSHV